MQASTKLCLATFEFVNNFENKRFLRLVPSPLGPFFPTLRLCFIYLQKSKHRSDILNGLNIVELVKKLRIQEKVLPF